MNEETNDFKETNIAPETEKASETGTVSSPGLKRKPKFSALLLGVLVLALAVPGAYLVYNSLAAKQVPGNTATCGTTKNTCKVGSPGNMSVSNYTNYTWACRGTLNPSSNFINCSIPIMDTVNFDMNDAGNTYTGVNGDIELKWLNYPWQSLASVCVSPQCTTPKLLTANNTVDFSKYPARDACKAMGARLPTVAEQMAYYNLLRAQYSAGTGHAKDYYWTAEENDKYTAKAVYFGGQDTKTTTYTVLNKTTGSECGPNGCGAHVRCVRDK